jgi:hypothetical protein
MVPDQANSILETVAASIQGTGGLRDIPVQAGDTLKDLDLSRLRLLAVLIDLEDSRRRQHHPAEILACAIRPQEHRFGWAPCTHPFSV